MLIRNCSTKKFSRLGNIVDLILSPYVSIPSKFRYAYFCFPTHYHPIDSSVNGRFLSLKLMVK